MAEVLSDIPGVQRVLRLADGSSCTVRAWGFGVLSANAGLVLGLLREMTEGLSGDDVAGVRGVAALEQVVRDSVTPAELERVRASDYGELLAAVVEVNALPELLGKVFGLRLAMLDRLEAAQVQELEAASEAAGEDLAKD